MVALVNKVIKNGSMLQDKEENPELVKALYVFFREELE